MALTLQVPLKLHCTIASTNSSTSRHASGCESCDSLVIALYLCPVLSLSSPCSWLDGPHSPSISCLVFHFSLHWIIQDPCCSLCYSNCIPQCCIFHVISSSKWYRNGPLTLSTFRISAVAPPASKGRLHIIVSLVRFEYEVNYFGRFRGKSNSLQLDLLVLFQFGTPSSAPFSTSTTSLP